MSNGTAAVVATAAATAAAAVSTAAAVAARGKTKGRKREKEKNRKGEKRKRQTCKHLRIYIYYILETTRSFNQRCVSLGSWKALSCKFQTFSMWRSQK